MQVVVFTTLAILTWTGFVLLLRGAMQVWPVGLGGAYSSLITVAILAVSITLTPGGWSQLKLRRTGRWILLMGLVAIGASILNFAGLKETNVTDATLISRMDLLFVILLGPLLRLERINTAGLLVAPLMFAGLILLMHIQRLQLQGHLLGDLMMLGFALALAINAFVIRYIMRQLNEQAVSFYNTLFTALGFAALAMIQGIDVPANVTAKPALWWWIPILGVAAAVSLLSYYAALRRMSVWKLRVFMLTTPFLAAIADWLIWRHTLKASQWLGAAMLLGGTIWLIRTEWQTTLDSVPDIAMSGDTASE